MALKTLGTNATSSLSALVFGSNVTPADIATLTANIKDDINVAHPIWPGALLGMAGKGTLYIPNRGVLTVQAGDYIAVDATTGWPILVSAYSIASGPWTHS